MNRYKTPFTVVQRNTILLVSTMVLTFALLRCYLHVWPDTDLRVAGREIHHLFTGVMLIVAGGVPLALFRGSTYRLDFALILFGAGLAMTLDEWLYLIVTDGSNQSYLLPVSFWGGAVLVTTASVYGLVLFLLRLYRKERASS